MISKEVVHPAFSYSDAMAYYCILPHFKPQHVLEVGAGFSTLIVDEALKKNGGGRITLIEPYPTEFLRKLNSVECVIESLAQDVPVAALINLVESADIWSRAGAPGGVAHDLRRLLRL